MQSTKPSKILSLPVVFIASAAAVICSAASQSEDSSQAATPASAKPAASKTSCAKPTDSNAAGAKAADGTSASGKTSAAQVLDPSKFFGEAQAAYEAARQCPDLCANLFCYCGCDHTDNHASLLDCYITDHSADCEICQKSVFIGLAMKKDGKSLREIQAAIDEKFASEYPYEDPSPALLAYRAKRDGKPIPKSPDPKSKQKAASPAKLKPGKKAGDCCGHGHKG